MSYRKARLSHVIRDVVSDAISNRLSDPRICRFTSVTRVELSPDSRYVNVHVSIMGSEAEAGKTMQGLASARGMIQSRLARELDIRQCPLLRFEHDRGFKIAMDTYRLIEESKRQDESFAVDKPGAEAGASRSDDPYIDPSSNSEDEP